MKKKHFTQALLNASFLNCSFQLCRDLFKNKIKKFFRLLKFLDFGFSIKFRALLQL